MLKRAPKGPGAAPAKKKSKQALPARSTQRQDEDSGDEEEVAVTASAPSLKAASAVAEAPPSFDGQYVNKQRVLVFCSRGVTARARHLLEDLRRLVSVRVSPRGVGACGIPTCAPT